MSFLFDKIHSDILFSINRFLNPVDRYLLRTVCTKFRKYFTVQYNPTIDNLIQYGYLQLAIRKGMRIDANTLCIAASYGQLHIVKYISEQEKEKICLWDEWTSSNVARNGHLHILQWLHENGCPWNESICANAALNGHLDVLKWLREQGCSWDEAICNNAAKNGYLEVLKWARSQGCPWNESTCHNAALYGHLDVLKWAYENGCPWNEWTCYNAAMNGHFKVVDWALEHGAPMNQWTGYYMQYRVVK